VCALREVSLDEAACRIDRSTGEPVAVKVINLEDVYASLASDSTCRDAHDVPPLQRR
jgi:hypothetical protein